MALDFPNPAGQTPANIFSPTSTPSASTNGVTYVYDGNKWVAAGSGSGGSGVTPDLQSVTDEGNNTTNDIITTGDIIADNIVATGDVQTTSLNGSQLAGFRNMIINGAMQIAQRGTQVTNQSGSKYLTVDRFSVSRNALTAHVYTYDQVDDGPAGFGHALKLTTTTVEGSVDASDALRAARYKIEGQDIQHLQQGTANAQSLTLSFWVKSNTAGTYVVNFTRMTAGDNREITRTYTISNDQATNEDWVRVVLTIPGDTAGDEIEDNNEAGFDILWCVGAGSNWTGTDSTNWQNGNGGAAFGQTAQLQNTASAEWSLTGVQLELGPVATPFEHRPIGTELALCQRYYQHLGRLQGARSQPTNELSCGFSTSLLVPIRLDVGPDSVDMTQIGFTTITNGPLTLDRTTFFLSANADSGTSGVIADDITIDAEL